MTMTMKLLTTTPLLALLLTMSACSQTPDAPAAAAQTPEQSTDDSGVTGLWRMTSLEVGTEGNLQPIPYTGQIAFTDSTVSVQAMKPDTTAADTQFTLGGYEAFYGDADIDHEAGTFAVTVESAVARSLIGQTLTRNFEVNGDTLVLTPINPADGFRVTYQRHAQ